MEKKKPWWQPLSYVGGASFLIAQTAFSHNYDWVALVFLILGILSTATFFFMKAGDR